jgi:CcmD family protein
MTVPPNNLPFLFAAFAVVWAVFFIYAAYMSWRRQSVQRDLRELQATVVSDEGPDREEAERIEPV